MLTGDLNRLARLLRVLGYDAVVTLKTNKKNLENLCRLQNRILLTRIKLPEKLPQGSRLLFINSEKPLEQLRQVISDLGLKEYKPFSRCLDCNRLLELIDKDRVLNLLPEKVQERQNFFTRCPHCHKIYWQGTHYDAMLKTLSSVIDNPENRN
ncbi:MAG TPA: Mut7-C RNAse domain-containing protein [Candidatus Cloacimonadota bacterium]|nr:Mut7-C RNAse domain-containing protein [Candidatus Cloacimonadota bacterium]HOV16921.1 Mut7-C RNAse domain-containing protein [Candidatus Cloacimonadota bacterium]HQL14167.1 Mut7-C RNAse domain-containing protein [Candidatus Cloacimonadota bacterium]